MATVENPNPETRVGDELIQGQLQVEDALILQDGVNDSAILKSDDGALTVNDAEVPVLDEEGQLDPGVVPAVTISSFTVVVDETEQLALDAEEGDLVYRTDQASANPTWIHNGGTEGDLTDWTRLDADAVVSVAGKTGAVTLVVADITDFDPADYATLASPALTGTPTAPTADPDDDSTQIATTEYVQAELADTATASQVTALSIFPFISSFWGVPADNEVIFKANVPVDVELPADLAGSIVTSDIAATAETVITVKRNSTTIGTLTFAIGGTTATLATVGGTAKAFGPGDQLVLVGPADNDATLADIHWTLQATMTDV